jgi:hypothetical protein
MSVSEALTRGRDAIRRAGTAVLDAAIGKLGARLRWLALWLAAAALLVWGIAWAVTPPKINFFAACVRAEANKYGTEHPGAGDDERESVAEAKCFPFTLDAIAMTRRFDDFKHLEEARRIWLLQHTEADIRAQVRARLGLQPWDESMYPPAWILFP